MKAVALALAFLASATAFVPAAPRAPWRRARAAASSSLCMAAVDSTLIIQNKGGGHGEIGLVARRSERPPPPR